jgi:hypothetical protein
MARIVVIQHASERPDCAGFAAQLLIDRWRQHGHEVLIACGCEELPDGDLAFLHVNLSVVPEAYMKAARRYSLTINANARDIRKRSVSRNLIDKNDGWSGPVIVKSNLNCNGIPEFAAIWKPRGRLPIPGEAVFKPVGYQVLDHPGLVPEYVWTNPEAVVERFLPEKDSSGYYLRTWIFLGERECSRRFLAAKPIIKGKDYLAAAPCDVPEFLRSERERLSMDYGKFDFVIHEGKAILLDANKTMGLPSPHYQWPYTEIAPALETLLAGNGRPISYRSERRP